MKKILTTLVIGAFAVGCASTKGDEAAPASAPAASAVDAMMDQDIVDTAISAGSFNTLAAALKSAHLVEALKGEGPFTVFAPTDEAFAALPAGTLENLLKPENEAELVRILKYHVVPGKVTAAEVVQVSSADTLAGEALAIDASGETVLVGDAHVVKSDVMAKNGVIHVIDKVLLPPQS
jgi:uncharacterized surface protein with fasciclin (FAS1) repeats